MTALQNLPKVHDCSASGCAFNADTACHASAITIGGDHAHCGTFVTLDVKPMSDVAGAVGACHRIDCTHNEKLSCTAQSVSIGEGADMADCLTFEAR